MTWLIALLIFVLHGFAGGMKTTSTITEASAASTADKKKSKGKKGANRRIKIQNTHLKELGIDLSKDFLKPGTLSKK